MQPEPESRVAEIVEGALECDPRERSVFVAQSCAGDAGLLTEVESLLRSLDSVDRFLETPAAQQNAASFLGSDGGLQPGRRLGEYEIISLLGEGGMGEVYLAEDLALGRQVAIKWIKRSFVGANPRRLFRHEERILAGLNDPHIARLYGAAVTPEGAPYFVMEYVNGPRLDEYCDERGLTVEERLILFRKVCSAVAYAHQHLVIHRDLKPANIRVTAEGEPKLLDFGIAKLLDPARVSNADQTGTLSGMMTPAYASPEQLRGEPMTTVSDVYSLGVILYELLVGERPPELAALPSHGIGRAMEAHDAPPPSAAVLRPGRNPAALRATRKLDPEGLRRRIEGDLDNIVRMAMRQEPERRYASVGQFSDDIRRHLEALPVIAQKDTLSYRTAKFVRRHRASVAAAALLFLTLVGGIVATAWQAHRVEQQRVRAERRFDEVRRLAHSLMFEIHDSIQNLAGSTPTRRLIVSRALEYLESLAQESGGSPALRRELAIAYEKIGEIQGNPYSANLGDTDGALASYRKATAILENLNTSRGIDDTRGELARCYRALGDVLEQKAELEEMLRQYRKSLAIFADLSAENPGDFLARRELARTWEALGDGLSRTTDAIAEPLDCYRKNLAIMQDLLAGNPADSALRRGTALALVKIGMTADSKDPAAAASLVQAIDILQDLSAAQPENARARREYAFACSNLGELLEGNGDYPTALTYLRRALALRQEIAAQDPQSAQAQYDLFQGHDNLCKALTLANESTEAIKHGLLAVGQMERVLVMDPSNAAYRRNSGVGDESLGDAFANAGDELKNPVVVRLEAWTQAQQWYENGLQVFAGLRRQGALRPTDSEKPEKLAAKVAKSAQARSLLSH